MPTVGALILHITEALTTPMAVDSKYPPEVEVILLREKVADLTRQIERLSSVIIAKPKK